KRKPQRVRLRMSRVKRVLGVAPAPALARKVLTGLGLPVKSRGADLEVTVASLRRDLSLEDDLVEELVRAWRSDRIPSTLPADVRVFEVGKVYQWGNGDTGTSEPRWVAIALTGGRGEAGWSGTPEPVDVYDAKGLAEHVVVALAVRAGTGGAGALSGFEPDC